MVGTGRIWFEFPTLIAFPSLYQLRRGAWRSPCKDVLIILSVCAVFVYFQVTNHAETEVAVDMGDL